MSIKLVIFDFDGTIADTRKSIVVSKQEMMRRLGLEVKSDDECASVIGLPAEDGYRLLYPDASDKTIEDCVRVARDTFAISKVEYPPTVFDGIREVLEELKKRGIMCSIASSRNNPSLRGFLESWDMTDFFQYVLGADDTKNHKPDPEPVFKTLKDLSINPEDAIVVGDTAFDISMGKGAGIHTCAVTYGISKRAALEETGAEHIIDHISELLEII
ncbi:MAG: HAD family hydrolase [Lachnospiraceae bacterium]|nr:HAD family hydrolase [Lachnospiraceae bacterium]